MFSENTGKDLLDEMKLKEIKLYNVQDINKIKSEILEIDVKIESLKNIVALNDNEVTKELSANYSMLKSYKDRLIRIEKSYHFFRFLKIQKNYFLKKDIKKFLNLNETEFEKEFSLLCNDYFEKYKHLSLADRTPPLDFYVQILTLEDCGLIISGDEFIELKKNKIYFLKKSDIIHLLDKNKIKII